MTKYSIVIPTLWIPEFFPSFLDELDSCEQVFEIIVISNKRLKEPSGDWKKVKIVSQQYNIGVNPSWNLGVELAEKEDLIIANDDLVFDLSFFETLSTLLSEDPDVGIVGLNTISNNVTKLDKNIKSPGMYCLFYIHKRNYKKIPNSFKTFFGDDWLRLNCDDKNKNSYIIPTRINGILSLSSKKYRGTLPIESENFKRETTKDYN